MCKKNQLTKWQDGIEEIIVENKPHRRLVLTTNEENQDKYGLLFWFYMEYNIDQNLFMWLSCLIQILERKRLMGLTCILVCVAIDQNPNQFDHAKVYTLLVVKS